MSLVLYIVLAYLAIGFLIGSHRLITACMEVPVEKLQLEAIIASSVVLMFLWPIELLEILVCFFL